MWLLNKLVVKNDTINPSLIKKAIFKSLNFYFYRNNQHNAATESMQVDKEVRNVNTSQANEQIVENNEARFNIYTINT